MTPAAPRLAHRPLAVALLLLLSATFAPEARARSAEADAAIARADAAWARRAQGASDDGRAAPEAAAEAVRSAEAAVAAAPDDPAPRWRLLRALHFRADFASAGADAEREVLELAIREADAATEVLARRARGVARDGAALLALEADALVESFAPEERSDAAGVFFWSAIAWGAWSQRTGLLAAVREGVANRVHAGALAATALDERFDEGGAHRLLARLHATLPRLPWVSGWVDRGRALPEIERALAIAPGHLGNRMLAALTLLDVAPGRRGEALQGLAAVAEAEPRADRLVEERAIRREARERLALELEKAS